MAQINKRVCDNCGEECRNYDNQVLHLMPVEEAHKESVLDISDNNTNMISYISYAAVNIHSTMKDICGTCILKMIKEM